MINTFDQEKELLIQLRNHDEKALADLMRAHYRFLYNYANCFTKDQELIKDAIQEIFISLWQRKETADLIHSLRFYLLGAVKNIILKNILKDKRRNQVSEDQLEYHFKSELWVEKIIIDRELAEENTLRLKMIITKLSYRQKEIIYLKFYQQLDAGQIAELMSISQQSVYNLLHETINKLRKCWQSQLFT
jgi:RNA polymerase sigma factor (sigma-70 family)